MENDLFNELKESIQQMKKIQSGKIAPGRIRIQSPQNEVTKHAPVFK